MPITIFWRRDLNDVLDRLESIENKLNVVLSNQRISTKKESQIMSATTDVLDKVRAQRTVVDSLKVASDAEIAFQLDLKTRLDAAIASGADTATLQTISDELGANTEKTAAVQQDLANAIVDNTAASGETPPTP